ncbi:MAG: ankyrin repeat domain-containing protein [Longimicrobiales bacterium]
MIRLPALLLALLLAGPVAESPVADAAQRGDLDTIRVLLREGADVNAAQNDGMSALHWAAQNDDAAVIEVLLYAGANMAATTRLGGYTPLHLAGRAGNASALEALLSGGSDPRTLTSTGVTALHFASASGRTDAIEVLIRHGANIDAGTTSDAQTPLMWATASNRLDAMRTLLDAGADPSLTTSVVDYVQIAAEDIPQRRLRAQLASVRRNAERGGGPPPAAARSGTGQLQSPPPPEEEAEEDDESEEDEESPEEQEGTENENDEGEDDTEEQDNAENESEDEEASAVGERPAPPAEEERPLGYTDLVGKEGGFTALHFAARDGFRQAAELLLAHGAELDQPTAGDGTTPMLMATINGHFDLAMHFLSEGADPNATAEDGAAPLFTVLNRRWGPKAAYPQPQAFRQQQTDYLELMEALMVAGADVNHRADRHIWYTSFNFDMLGVNFSGATAFWRAAYATDLDAMRLLVAWGADPSIPTRKVPARRFGRRGNQEDQSGLPPVPTGGPGVHPIHAASGVGYGEGFAANQHSHAPDSWVPAVRYLVEEHGADVNARDLNGYSPVHHAASRGDNELIDYLVEHGADVTFVSRRGETTVDMANGPRQRVQPFPATIALLERLGAHNNDNCQSCQ